MSRSCHPRFNKGEWTIDDEPVTAGADEINSIPKIAHSIRGIDHSIRGIDQVRNDSGLIKKATVFYETANGAEPLDVGLIKSSSGTVTGFTLDEWIDRPVTTVRSTSLSPDINISSQGGAGRISVPDGEYLISGHTTFFPSKKDFIVRARLKGTQTTYGSISTPMVVKNSAGTSNYTILIPFSTIIEVPDGDVIRLQSHAAGLDSTLTSQEAVDARWGAATKVSQVETYSLITILPVG